MAEINITPFTDVLLVLLIIFMLLAALATPPGFQKAFPRPQQHGPDDVRRSLRVDVVTPSRILIDGVAAHDLDAAMRDAVRRHTADPQRFNRHIELLATASIPYQTIVSVLDAGRLAGDDDVGLVIEEGEGR